MPLLNVPPRSMGRPFDTEWGRAVEARVADRVRRGLPPERVIKATGYPLTPEIQAARDRGVLDRQPMFDRIAPDGIAWDDGSHEAVDVILWCTGFRAVLDHLAQLGLRRPGGGIAVDGTRAIDDPRIHLVGYGPSASTIGANRAGRVAAREIRRYLDGVDATAQAAWRHRRNPSLIVTARFSWQAGDRGGTESPGSYGNGREEPPDLDDHHTQADTRPSPHLRRRARRDDVSTPEHITRCAARRLRRALHRHTRRPERPPLVELRARLVSRARVFYEYVDWHDHEAGTDKDDAEFNVNEADLTRLRVEAIQPVITGLLTDEEVSSVKLGWEGVEGDTAESLILRVVAAREQFVMYVWTPGQQTETDAQLSRRLASDLQDWIAQSSFAWGQRRHYSPGDTPSH